MAWDLCLTLDPSMEGPLVRRVVAAITAEIRGGRLGVGTVLPGTRRLSVTLGVHRNTVVAAYRELASAGWIDTRPGRGTFVLANVDAAPSANIATERSRRTAYAVSSAEVDVDQSARGERSMLAFSHMPDPRAAPRVALARAYRRALTANAATVLDYGNRRGLGTTLGEPRLRVALAEFAMRTRGLPVSAQDVMVTSGSQMALYLIALVLVEPGDVIAVESHGYRPVWEAFRIAGATLVPLPIDREGVDVAALQRLVSQRRVRAVYVTPQCQHPTGAQLSAPRRRALLDLAVAAKIAIIEDDFDAGFSYVADECKPLAAMDRHGAVIYVGSLSKLLAPGVRVGFTVAPPVLLQRMAQRRGVIDRQGDHALDRAIAELLDDGELRRHHQRMQAVYLARRDLLADALESDLDGVLTFERPARGTAIWAGVRPGIDVDAWHARALACGASFNPGRVYTFQDAPSTHASFGFAGLDAPQLRQAVTRLTAALPRPRSASRRTGPVHGEIGKADLAGPVSPP